MRQCDLTKGKFKFIYCNHIDFGFKDYNKPLKIIVNLGIITLLAGESAKGEVK